MEKTMTRKEAVALLERYSNYGGMGMPNLAGCKEAIKVAVDALKEAFPELAESEDERIRKAIVLGIKRCADAGSIFGTIINNEGISYNDVLTYLEKQKEQKFEPFSWGHENGGNSEKPNNQWSEEDEAKKKRLISIVKRALQENKYPLLNCDGATELIDWIKSLRPQPHWKPSEEQMEALKHYVDTTTDGEIELLYNDLKKL